MSDPKENLRVFHESLRIYQNPKTVQPNLSRDASQINSAWIEKHCGNQVAEENLFQFLKNSGQVSGKG
jgi:hypothetical protein